MSTLSNESEVEQAARKRWATDGKLRRLHGCSASDPADAVYQHKLARFVAAEAKSFRDRTRPAFQADPNSESVIERALRENR